MLETARNVIWCVEPTPTYARVDLVRGHSGKPLLLELELIEPSMYLRKSLKAPARFAAAFERYFNRTAGGRTL